MSRTLIDRDTLIAIINGMSAASPGAFVKHDDAYAAMCIIEEMVDPCGMMYDAGRPWNDWRDQVGIAEVRGRVLRTLAPAANAAWEKAYAAYEHGCVKAQVEGTDHPPDPGSFDYDFVPTWLRVAVDWSDLLNGPRVLGKGGK